ncbi:MAG: FHA domain-containing protein [Planctomycetes bacterium]|nr:FHA domain-containing protein [Planctomycetota bacterium]
MKNLRAIAKKADHAIISSRLNSFAVMMTTDRTQRLTRISAVLKKLPEGAYLIGTGPSTVGIIPLTVEEVVLGRSATPLEEPADTVVDYEIGDTMYLGPHEVSRVHAKILRTRDSRGLEFSICDLESTCGTFVNGEQIDDKGVGRHLSHGDAISMGPSHTSTYLYVEVASDGTETSGA